MPRSAHAAAQRVQVAFRKVHSAAAHNGRTVPSGRSSRSARRRSIPARTDSRAAGPRRKRPAAAPCAAACSTRARIFSSVASRFSQTGAIWARATFRVMLVSARRICFRDGRWRRRRWRSGEHGRRLVAQDFSRLSGCRAPPASAPSRPVCRPHRIRRLRHLPYAPPTAGC